MRALKNPKSKYFHDIVCVSMIVFELMIHSYTYSSVYILALVSCSDPWQSQDGCMVIK